MLVSLSLKFPDLEFDIDFDLAPFALYFCLGLQGSFATFCFFEVQVHQLFDSSLINFTGKYFTLLSLVAICKLYINFNWNLNSFCILRLQFYWKLMHLTDKYSNPQCPESAEEYERVSCFVVTCWTRSLGLAPPLNLKRYHGLFNLRKYKWRFNIEKRKIIVKLYRKLVVKRERPFVN